MSGSAPALGTIHPPVSISGSGWQPCCWGRASARALGWRSEQEETVGMEG